MIKNGKNGRYKDTNFFPKLIFTLNAITIEITIGFFMDFYRLILKFIWKGKE